MPDTVVNSYDRCEMTYDWTSRLLLRRRRVGDHGVVKTAGGAREGAWRGKTEEEHDVNDHDKEWAESVIGEIATK